MGDSRGMAAGCAALDRTTAAESDPRNSCLAATADLRSSMDRLAGRSDCAGLPHIDVDVLESNGQIMADGH
jgi:hypothetical protein